MVRQNLKVISGTSHLPVVSGINQATRIQNFSSSKPFPQLETISKNKPAIIAFLRYGINHRIFTCVPVSYPITPLKNARANLCRHIKKQTFKNYSNER